MARPLITLTTDFGPGSAYVAAMKGVIFAQDPAAQVVDLCHAIPPQNVRHGAWFLAEACPWFPANTIHVAVIDPGVGTTRALVYARVGPHHYLAPDNGLLSRLAWATRPASVVRLANAAYWRPQVASTFHGRDILAPVAARLSQGLDPALLGPPQESLVELDWKEARVMPGRIEGVVEAIDSFGNLITNIRSDQLAAAPTDERLQVVCDDEHETRGLFHTYGEQPEMTLIALVGSSGYVELAIVGDSAAAMLGVGVGAKVCFAW